MLRNIYSKATLQRWTFILLESFKYILYYKFICNYKYTLQPEMCNFFSQMNYFTDNINTTVIWAPVYIKFLKCYA